MSGTWWAYLVVLACSALLCAGLTPVVMRITGRLVAVNYQGKHKTLVPRLGGGAIVVAFVAVMPVSSMLPPLTGRRGELATVLVVAVAIFLVGLVGDSRQMLPSWHVGAEVAGAIIIWSAGTGIGFVGVDMVNLFLTVLWFVAITNGFKLIDNMVGLAEGIAIITSLTLFALAVTNGQILLATLSIGLAGSTFGFVSHTLRSQRANLGESGVRFIGFLIAFLAVQLEGKTTAIIPFLSCSFVIFHLLFVIISRISIKLRSTQIGEKNPGQGLFTFGPPTTINMDSSYLVAVSIGILSVVINRLSLAVGLIFTGLICLGLIAGGVLLLKESRGKHDQKSRVVSRHDQS